MSSSHVSVLILQALARGHRFGFDIMDATGLPSGTVYPALRRLETAGVIESSWEGEERARKAARPRRRNYQLTRAGRAELVASEAKVRAVSRLFAKRERT